MAEATASTEDLPSNPEGEKETILDQKAALAKAILERAVAVNDPYRNVPKEEDERVRKAQSILNGTVQKAKETVEITAAASKSIPDDMRSRLPQSHLAMLREYFWDPYSNDWQPYFLGSLKSYSSKSGYGFVECAQSHQHWGTDVFVHKNQVPVPWGLGQPVEFSVIVNSEGKPQAADCLWLPKVPQQRAYPKGFFAQAFGANVGHGGMSPQTGIFSPHDPSRRIQITVPPAAATTPSETMPGVVQAQPSSTAGTGETPPAPTETKTADTTAEETTKPTRSLADGPFYIGTLKSFSAAQGYGFLHCEELKQQYSRDIYFDRSQLCRVYNVGMLAEFQIQLNNRGHPQARNIVWNPIPFAPRDGNKPGPPEPANMPRLPTQASLEKARKLLRLLNGKEFEGAIVAAIDYQGQGAEKGDSHDANTNERSIDFVSFVLDRVDGVDQEKVQLQDFVKMLLSLMIAKMLKQKFDLLRTKKFSVWLERYATEINAKEEAQVVQHFREVSAQIESALNNALAENPHMQEPSVSAKIHTVIEQLKQKAQL